MFQSKNHKQFSIKIKTIKMFVIFLSDEGQEGCFLSVPRGPVLQMRAREYLYLG